MKYDVTIVVHKCPNKCQTLPKTVEALQVQLSPIKKLETLLERKEHQHIDDVVDVVDVLVV